LNGGKAMRHTISFWFMMLFLVFFIGNDTLAADYFLFDKETNQILFMGKNDSEFSEKIEMVKNPDYIMATNNPDIYLAIFAPENVDKKKNNKQAEPQKGRLIIFNVATGRTEDIVELGYAPFRYIYTKDRSHFYISYKPAPDSETLTLLHYDISEKTSEKLEDFAKEVSHFVLSRDETVLYAIIPSNKKIKDPGKIQAINTLPLSIASTIPTENNPYALFCLDSDKLVIIDASTTNRKQSGRLRMVKASDYSIIEEKDFPAPFHIYNYWNPDSDTLITITNRAKKSYIFRTSPNGIITHEIDSTLLDSKYEADKELLYLLKAEDFQIIDYKNDQVTFCNTDQNYYDQYPYQINLIPNTEQAALFCYAGGKLKLIDLSQNSLLTKVKYGRPGKKFGNFMSNLIVSLALTAATSYTSGGYTYYTIYAVDLFRNGINIAYDQSKYLVLSAATKDITVFDKSFESPVYIVPPEDPLIMFQMDRLDSQVLLITENHIFQVNAEDLTLKPIIPFNKEAKGCLLLEEENRFVVMTDQELLVIDSLNFEVKNRFEFFGNPDQEYSRVKENEQRYYFIPTL
jgi:hypothetical protein